MVGMSKAKMENRALPKKFYLEAIAAPSGERWAILLDGKPVKTMAKQKLEIRSKPVADAVAAEWRAQKEYIDPAHMPLTRLCNIALDRVPQDRTLLIDDIVRYAETDLVCYHAPSSEKLGRLQHATFEPLMDWARVAYALDFVATDSIMPIMQSPLTMANARALIEQTTDAELAALALMVPLLGSYLLAVALWKGRIDEEQALKAARLDEDLHAEQYGVDDEAAAAWDAKQKDIRAAAFFLTHN